MCAGTPSQSDHSHHPLSIPSSSADILPLNQSSAEELESQQDQGQVEVSSQTDLVSITDLERDNQSLRSEIAMLKCTKATITPEVYVNNPEILKFYTGLPNWTIFYAVMALVSPSPPKMPNSQLNTIEMLAIFFMRIRLNVYEEDIAYRFDVHRTTVSQCFYRVLDVMHAKLFHLIKWPERETLHETVPSSFKHFLLMLCYHRL